ncbi:DUF11 domain-containing protein [Allomuricauda sp. d1]|uniref:DUF11 domain-containing protein n=1 Tax=Allomuricauda sp. d1 TaxID=3136725 RepID=UPI0031D6E818
MKKTLLLLLFGLFGQLTLLAQSADLSLELSVDDNFVDPGQEVTFTIRVINDGPDTALDVQVFSLLPPGYDFVGYDANNGSYNAVNGVWDIGGMGYGINAILRIRAIAKISGEHSLLAEVLASDLLDYDSVPNNGVDTDGDGDVYDDPDDEDDGDGQLVVVSGTPSSEGTSSGSPPPGGSASGTPSDAEALDCSGEEGTMDSCLIGTWDVDVSTISELCDCNPTGNIKITIESNPAGHLNAEFQLRFNFDDGDYDVHRGTLSACVIPRGSRGAFKQVGLSGVTLGTGNVHTHHNSRRGTTRDLTPDVLATMGGFSYSGCTASEFIAMYVVQLSKMR